MGEQTFTNVQTNERNANLDRTGKRGRAPGSTNLHSKYPSSIAKRLKLAGIDWIGSFGMAIKRNDRQLLSIWVKLLPFLVVTNAHRKSRYSKGKASKAALEALNDLEGR